MTFTTSMNLARVTCNGCGIDFWITQRFLNYLKRNGTEFWCPRGCRCSTGPGEVALLEKKLETVKGEREWLDAALKAAHGREDEARRSAASYKGQATRLRNKFMPKASEEVEVDE